MIPVRLLLEPRVLKHLLQRTLTNVQTRQTAKMMSSHMLSHISDPPDGASAEGTVRAVARLQNVAQCVRQLQPEKDQVGIGSSTPGAASGPHVSAGRQRRPALLPRQNAARVAQKPGH